MDLTGEHRINAPRAVVWAGLNDPETLKQSIDGIDEITKTSDTEFEALAVVKVGPVKAKFKGKITLSDLDPPNGYTITGEGQGGVAGFAKGGAKVMLEDAESGGTLLKYDVTAQIGGKLAQIGSRLVDGAARKYADDFFTAFAAIVESRVPAAAPPPMPIGPESLVELAAGAEPPIAAHAADSTDTSSDTGSKGLPPVAWIGGLIVVVGAGLWWFLRR